MKILHNDNIVLTRIFLQVNSGIISKQGEWFQNDVKRIHEYF